MRKYGTISIILTIILDQLVKIGLLNIWMNPPKLIPVTPFFNIILTFNTGVSFGLFSSSEQIRLWMLISLTSLITIVLFFWMLREKNLITIIALGLIIGGAIGNIIDRLNYGAVVDYIQLYIGQYYWPAFNIADTAICIGAGLIILESLNLIKRKKL